MKSRVVLLAALALVSAGAVAQSWNQIQKLTAEELVESSLVGYSVATDGDVLVLGAPGNEFDADAPAGAVYVFERLPGGEWLQTALLTAALAEINGRLGASVAISGDVIVAGEPLAGPERGAAHVFERDEATGLWTESQRLRPTDLAPDDHFGESVAVEGTTIVIGSPEDDDNGDRSGSVYVYERDPASANWVDDAKLLASDGEAIDIFGTAVGIGTGTIAVGAPFTDDFGFISGKVYLFERDAGTGEWSESSQLIASDSSSGDWFGVSLAIDDSIVAVGATGSDGVGAFSGAVYVFERDAEGAGWTETGKLIALDGGEDEDLATSVAVADGLVAVGAPDADVQGFIGSGTAYVFEKKFESGVWEEVGLGVAEDPDNLADLGHSVALNGRNLIAGAPFDSGDTFFGHYGAAYTFELIANGGTLTGVAVDRLACQNKATGGAASHLEDSGWDCAASGLQISPGDKIRAQLKGTATGEPISGRLIGLLAPGVQCHNRASGQTVGGPVDAFGDWACDGFDPEPLPGDGLTIRVTGFAN